MSKFKWVIIAIGVTCVTMIIIIIFNVHQQEIPKNKPLDFSVKTVSGKYFNTNSLQKSPTLVFFLNPECENCMSEAVFISQNIEKLSAKYNILLIVTSDLQSSAPFLLTYLGFIDHQGVLIGFDDKYILYKMYDVSSVPVCILFDSNKKQVNRIITPLNSITQIELLYK